MFNLTLHNRFEALQQLIEEEELPMEEEWRQIEQGHVKTCDPEKVLGRVKTKKMEWISKETPEIIDLRTKAKNTENRTRCQDKKAEEGCE